jgi:hypothetical protein
MLVLCRTKRDGKRNAKEREVFPGFIVRSIVNLRDRIRGPDTRSGTRRPRSCVGEATTGVGMGLVGSRAFILRLSIRIQYIAPALPREDKGVISARRGGQNCP